MPALLDMSGIPLPSAVAVLDYQTIRAERLARYAELMEIGVDEVDDNDPAMRAIELGAYRELLKRASINDSVRDTMLASASGPGLDDLGADPLYGNTARLVLDPGDPDAVPPIPPTYESDRAYRARLALAPAALSVAGPSGAYEVRTRSAHPDVVDAYVSSPNPCEILIEVLHNSSDSAILTKIAAALSGKFVRPIGDRVTVQAAARETSSKLITLYVPDGPDLLAVQQASQTRVNELLLPLCARVRSGAALSEGVANAWLGACVVPGVRSWASVGTGASDPAKAWWPMTITVIAVRSNA